jgi:hypothetical protein
VHGVHVCVDSQATSSIGNPRTAIGNRQVACWDGRRQGPAGTVAGDISIAISRDDRVDMWIRIGKFLGRTPECAEEGEEDRGVEASRHPVGGEGSLRLQRETIRPRSDSPS